MGDNINLFQMFDHDKISIHPNTLAFVTQFKFFWGHLLHDLLHGSASFQQHPRETQAKLKYVFIKHFEIGIGHSGGWVYFDGDEDFWRPIGYQELKMLGIGGMDAVFGLQINASTFKWVSSITVDIELLVINNCYVLKSSFALW